MISMRGIARVLTPTERKRCIFTFYSEKKTWCIKLPRTTQESAVITGIEEDYDKKKNIKKLLSLRGDQRRERNIEGGEQAWERTAARFL